MNPTESADKFEIRNYRVEDKSGAMYVCMRTGDHGGEGEPFFREDPDALGRIYVEPYLEFEPDLVLILDGGGKGVCGYAMGCRDTRDLFQQYETQLRPALVKRFPAPTGDPGSWDRVQETYYLYHYPDYQTPEPYEQYPAHMHIDLLPEAQGGGWGRRLMTLMLDRLRKTGVPGVHLGMSGVNERAYGFYRHLGFQELARVGEGVDESIYMGMKFREIG